MRTCRQHLGDLLAAAAEGGMLAGQRAVIGDLPGKFLRAASKITRCLESNIRSVRDGEGGVFPHVVRCFQWPQDWVFCLLLDLAKSWLLPHRITSWDDLILNT